MVLKVTELGYLNSCKWVTLYKLYWFAKVIWVFRYIRIGLFGYECQLAFVFFSSYPTRLLVRSCTSFCIVSSVPLKSVFLKSIWSSKFIVLNRMGLRSVQVIFFLFASCKNFNLRIIISQGLYCVCYLPGEQGSVIVPQCHIGAILSVVRAIRHLCIVHNYSRQYFFKFLTSIPFWYISDRNY